MNIQEKAELLLKINRAKFCQEHFEKTGVRLFSSINYRAAIQLENELLSADVIEYDEAYKLLDNRKKRIQRLKKKIDILLSYPDCIFCTLTFDDDTLSCTSPSTRRRYVRSFLCSFGFPFVCNIDFGKQNHREHYHAVIADKISPTSWGYGACNVKFINRKSSVNVNIITKYVSKLVFHAEKNLSHSRLMVYDPKHEFVKPSIDVVFDILKDFA